MSVFEWGIVAARFLQFGSTLALFGLSLFCLYGIKNGTSFVPSKRWQWPHRAVLAAGAMAATGVSWWVSQQAAVFFPNTGMFDIESNWIIFTETGFGRVSLLRFVLLILSIVIALFITPTKMAWVAQSFLGGAILSTFAWTGHGIYNSGIAGLIHTAADVVHLLAAGVWIGALVALSVLTRRSLKTQTVSDAQTMLENLEKFSGIGPAIVAVLVLTGVINSWFLVGIEQWKGLIVTPYGNALMIKLVLFGGMLLLAASHKFHLGPVLRTDIELIRPVGYSLRALRTSILAETALAFLVLGAVAILGMLEPTITAVE